MSGRTGRKPGYRVGYALGIVGGAMAIPAAGGLFLGNLTGRWPSFLPREAMAGLLWPGLLLLVVGAVLIRKNR